MYLPPFCGFTPEQWKHIGHEYDEVRDACSAGILPTTASVILTRIGFSLITIRNGNRKMADKYPKVYC